MARLQLPLLPLLLGLSCTARTATDTRDAGEDTGDDTLGDGDGEGEDEPGSSEGDGDGEPSSGDGDGEPSSGDGDGDGDPIVCADPNDPNAPIVAVTGPIDADTTWTCDTIYRLAPDTQVLVNGAVLTIEPGTTVLGTSGSLLVIAQDARIEASGTADAPIVFTSSEAAPAPNDWSGLILIGSATNNLPDGVGQVEGVFNPPSFGGDDDSHDCGTLQYLRVEYTGWSYADGTEHNAISFYSCGSETTVDHVQAHMPAHAGLEIIGGTVDLDHIVVTGAGDDSIEIGLGYRGTAQWVFAQQNPQVGDNCFELSNQLTDFAATPRSALQICNATCIGSGPTGEKSQGLTFEQGTEAGVYASIVTYVTNEFALLADEATYAVLEAGGIELRNNLFFAGGASPWTSGADSLDSAQWEAWVLADGHTNLLADPGVDTTWGDPDASPSGDVSGTGEVHPSCVPTDYVGAVAPEGEDWTRAAWIRYAP